MHKMIVKEFSVRCPRSWVEMFEKLWVKVRIEKYSIQHANFQYDVILTGRADSIPIFLHEIPLLFRRGLIPVDVALIHVKIVFLPIAQMFNLNFYAFILL